MFMNKAIPNCQFKHSWILDKCRHLHNGLSVSINSYFLEHAKNKSHKCNIFLTKERLYTHFFFATNRNVAFFDFE